jgi:DNA replication protein DnaC
VCGPSGTGKTHFLEALGQAAVDAGHKVSWFSLEHLGALVRRHGADDTTAKANRRIMRADVIVIDDIGLLPVTTETSEALYRVVDAAYEKRSIALSSNLHRAGSTSSCPRPSPTPPSTASCTTPMSCSPPATASDSPKPPPARG